MEDLIQKHELMFPEILKSCYPNDNNDFKRGDIIEFWGGYNGDIKFKSIVTGGKETGEIYVLWDCHWLHIKNEQNRGIKKIETADLKDTILSKLLKIGLFPVGCYATLPVNILDAINTCNLFGFDYWIERTTFGEKIQSIVKELYNELKLIKE